MIQEAIAAQAAFAGHLDFDNLSPAGIRACKRIVLDSLGAMAAGAVQTGDCLPPDAEGGSCTVIGRRGTSNREWAAFLNGSHMVATEMDEGNQFAKGHPMSHLFPALMAAAEGGSYCGRDFITAVVCAYEVASRWGRAVVLRPEVHPHGNWGTAAAACAVAKLRKSTEKEIEAAILLANSIPLPSAWASAFAGVNVRDVYIGLSNMHGLMVSGMLEAGFVSSPEVISSMYGALLGNGVDPASLSEGLGKEFLIEKNYFKPHASCRFTHGVIDALEKIHQDGPLKGIREIRVETYSVAAALDKKNPATILAAKFSIPYIAALQIMKGGVRQEDFTLQCLQDPELARLADLVTVRENPSFTALLPDKRATKVSVLLADGTKRGSMVDVLKGDFTDPLTDLELEEKFHHLCANIWTVEQRGRIIEAVGNLEKLENVNSLFALLRIK